MQVGKGREGWYLIVAVVIFVPALIFIIWGEVWLNDQDDLYTTVTRIGSNLAPWLILSFGLSLLIVEGVTMLSEQYLKRRYREGKAEGRVEGLAEGRVEGREEERKSWVEWNKRREEAAARGEDFTEPPPSANGKEG